MKTIVYKNIKITHLNHASFLLTTPNLVIYIDPFKVDGPKADLIFITHDHFDHFDPETLAKLKKDETIMVIPEILKGKIFGKVETFTPNETKTASDILVTALPMYNKNHPAEKNYVGYILDINGIRIFHAGDSGVEPEISKLKNIDIAMLPIDGVYTITEKEAAAMVCEFKPKIVVPMHYRSDLGGDPNKFKELVNDCSQVEILE